MKLCVNCKYCDQGVSGYYCNATGSVSLVTGKMIGRNACDYERGHYGTCNEEGRNFKEKDPKPVGPDNSYEEQQI